ncbi:hypothetical protein Hdeb2414_s0003g00103351 [Helianthus debilis subsp. tardiflorus]
MSPITASDMQAKNTSQALIPQTPSVNHCIIGRIPFITAGIRRPGRGWISDPSNRLSG